jgi:hypothetical protein
MFSVRDKRILKYTQNYKINLIEPASIPDEDFAKLRTELSQVLKYVKYSADKKKLKEIVDEDEVYSNISRRTANMINIVTGSDFKIDNGKEKINMCEAIKGMREDARMEGRNEGLIAGRNEGLIAGRNEGLITGRTEGLIEGARDANIETARKVLALGKLSFDEIAAIYNLTLEEVKKLAEEK